MMIYDSKSGTFTLPTPQAIADLFRMTPYYWKTPRQGAARLGILPGGVTDRAHPGLYSGLSKPSSYTPQSNKST